MVTEIDHQAVKTRISAILQAESTIYSARENDQDRLRDVLVGMPDGGDAGSDYLNYAFITNSPSGFDTMVRKGQTVENNNDRPAILMEHDVRYSIVVIMDEKNSPTVEKALDNIQKAILETLEENPQLLDASQQNPLCDISWPERVEPYKPELYRGKSKQGRIITLHCKISTG